MNMKAFLRDDPPSYYSDKGLQCAFPYRELEVLCSVCNHPLILSAGLISCHACPAVDAWLLESRDTLARLKAKRVLKVPTKIEIVSIHELYLEAA